MFFTCANCKKEFSTIYASADQTRYLCHKCFNVDDEEYAKRVKTAERRKNMTPQKQQESEDKYYE